MAGPGVSGRSQATAAPKFCTFHGVAEEQIRLGKALTRETGDVFCQGFPRGVFLVASVQFLRSPRLGSGSPTISGRNLTRPRIEPWEG